MINRNELETIPGSTVYGSDGEKIGRAGQVYVDDQSGEPEWLTVNTGLFGTNESFVPLRTAEISSDGVRVGYTKDHVKDAPNVDPDNGHLDESDEERLFRHYELGDGGSYGRTGDVDDDRTRSGVVGSAGTADRTSEGYDTSGPTTDEAMTRSEEQLRVGKEQRETGRARLRKYVVTEEQNVTVPVRREEVEIQREPITEANRGDAVSGPDISEEEHEVVLHEERPVVEKEAVPVERVRLGTKEVTEEQTVSGEVRKEQIETEGQGLSDEGRRG